MEERRKRERQEAILRGIREGADSRAALARALGTHPMTVGREIKRMTERGLLWEEKGVLRVSDRFCRLFLQLQAGVCEAWAEDLLGKELCRFRVPYEESLEERDNLERLLGSLQERMAFLGVKREAWRISVLFPRGKENFFGKAIDKPLTMVYN